MELLYVWIEDYKNIHHQGFNFSPKYRFEFNFEKKELTVKENKDTLPDKFFGENIANVTTIVGQNGSGKSNLVKAINYILGDLFRKIESSKESDFSGIQFILVLTIDKKKKIFHRYNKIAFDKKEVSEYIRNIEAENFSSIFFSNVFDGKYDSFEIANILDISTIRKLGFSRGTREYIQNEFKHQIDFVVNFKKKDVENLFFFPFPKKFSLSMAKVSLNDFQFLPNFKNKDKIKKIFLETTSTNAFKGIIGIIILFFFLRNPLVHTDYEDKVIKFFNNFNKRKRKNDFLDVIKFFLLEPGWINNQSLGSEKDQANSRKELGSYSITEESLNSLIKFIEQCQIIDNYFLYKEMKVKRSHHVNFQCKEIDQDNFKAIKDFFDSYANAFKIPEGRRDVMFDPIRYEWEGMSSGQLAMLNLFSRFYSVVKSPTRKKELKKNLILFIDEGELYLHADWQKKFLNSLLSGLQEIYKGHRLQIILTSHTPFVLSDIPKENIIFLNKDENGKCIVVNGLNKEKTFAANIHTLLSDSFFLEGGLIGEFASGKIKEIQKFYEEVKAIEKALIDEKILDKSKDKRLIQKEKEYQSKKDAFWKIQRMIGEEYLAAIVKNHLDEIETILLEKNTAKEEKISRLRKELEALEEEKGKKLK